MTLIIRPYRGRIVAGVVQGFAEYYQLNPWLLRAIYLSAMIAAPVMLLCYVILWISMPDEVMVLGELSLSEPDGLVTNERFEKLSGILLKRTGVMGKRSVWGPQAIAFLMLIIAFALEMPKLEGPNFYYLHPVISSLYSIVSRYSDALFYLTVAFAFFAIDRISPPPVSLPARSAMEVALDTGSTRAIGGLVSGISRVLELDSAYLRVLFVFLNILTFGVVGLIYLVLVWLLRKNRQPAEALAGDSSDSKQRLVFTPALRIAIGFLFLAMVFIRVATELRIFFFNEPFFQGLALIIIGLLFSMQALRDGGRSELSRVWVLGGCIVLLLGIDDLTSAVFQVQIPFASRFEIAYIIGALAFLYYTLVSLRGSQQRAGLAMTAILLLSAAMVQFNIAPTRFLLALVQFYDFFFPVIFAGFGLWLVMES